MALYARIENNKVAEIFETEGNIKDMFPDSFIWVDVTGEKTQPLDWPHKSPDSWYHLS